MSVIWIGRAGTQTLISQAAGTAIGDMTAHQAVGVAFDGTKTGSGTSGVAKASSPGYVGKDWGAGVTKIVTGVKVWSYDAGYNSGSATPCTLTLIGHSSNDPGSGTNLGTIAVETEGPSINSVKLSGFTETPFRYHWVKLDNGSDVQLQEVEFYETI